MVKKAYTKTPTNIYKSMGDLSKIIIKFGGEMQFTESISGISVSFSFPINGNWNKYRFTKEFDVGIFIKEYAKKHPRTKINNDKKIEVISEERDRIGRVFYHYIKNLFVAIDDGILDLGEAFMPFLVLPEGHDKAGYTLYEVLSTSIASGELSGNSLLALASNTQEIEV